MSKTEQRNPRAAGIDARETLDVLTLMNEEDAAVISAVRDALGEIARAVDDAVEAVKAGAHVVYAGAGTSGRLGALDAAEVKPTFSSSHFRAVMAGGPEAMTRAVEGAEDDVQAGLQAGAELGSEDMAVGISASGATPFVKGFLRGAKDKGARTWLITCNDIRGDRYIDGMIRLLSGPEIVAGSTRLKAGTATKLALNMLSTATMIRLGKVYDGLMVDVVPSNAKLLKRARGIIMAVTGCGEDEALEALKAADMKPKTACVMLKKGVSSDEADALLKRAQGSMRSVLDS